MLTRSTVVAFGILVLLIAGCVAPAANLKPTATAGGAVDISGERVPVPDKDLSKAIVSNHGAPYMHAIPELHTGSYRMDLVGYNPLTTPGQGDDPLIQNSGYAAVTIFHDLVCVSHFAGTGGEGGATIVNISNPAKPVVVASVVDAGIGSRCMFTEDGKYLLLADYGGVSPGLPVPAPLDSLGAFGVSVYDVKDVKSPKYLFHDSQGQAAGASSVGSSEYHNIGTALINGTNYIFQTYTGNILALAADGKSMKIVAHVEHTDHDMWVGHHPITGMWELVTGAGKGTAFYDISDPTHPILQGAWAGNKTYDGWHRQWPLAQTVGGNAIVVVAGEACGNGKSLPYTVLDWTDPTDVKELGHWQIPGNPEIQEPGQLCSMNSHEFNTWNGYVASGNYHAGVWLFDVGTPERTLEPTTVGYYEPHETPLMKGGTKNTPFAWNPDVWGAYFDDRGYVLAGDWYSGVYVLKFPGTLGANATAS